MKDKKLEVVKAVLIHWLNQKLLRKDIIDKEINSLTHVDDSNLDLEITRLEKLVNQKLKLLDKVINHKQHKQERIDLTNLKIQKGLILRLRNQRIESLLQEKESLAYNEYNYIFRIEELSKINTIEELVLTDDELSLLKKIFPSEDFLSNFEDGNKNIKG